MSPVSLLLNLLWIAFGGLWMALGWILAAALMVITIIGIPWARSALTIASYTFLPFGRRIEIVHRRASPACLGSLAT